MRPEEEDVTRHRLDGEVLVDRTDEGVVRVEEHPIVAHLGDGTTARQRGQSGATPSAHRAVDPIPVHVGASAAAARLHTVGDEIEHGVVVGALQLGVGCGVTEQLEEVGLLPLLGRHLGDDLLGEDVERSHGWLQRVEPASTDSGQEGGRLEQLVASERIETARRRAGTRVVRAAHALQEGGDAPR